MRLPRESASVGLGLSQRQPQLGLCVAELLCQPAGLGQVGQGVVAAPGADAAQPAVAERHHPPSLVEGVEQLQRAAVAALRGAQVEPLARGLCQVDLDHGRLGGTTGFLPALYSGFTARARCSN